jgi:hypothetical protein
VYTGIHNEQEERKDHSKDQHRTGSHEQGKHIKYRYYHINVPLRLWLEQTKGMQYKYV